MLSKKEKEEMLEDGRSQKRRKDFSQAKKVNSKGLDSLDEFIRFLMDIQKAFGQFAISRKRTITRFNKL